MLQIEQTHADEMVAHSMQETPNECCGILAGNDGVARSLYRITNAAANPYRYLMDPQEFLDADLDSERKGQHFVAFYHSHTHSPAYPSETDVRMALQSGYLGVHYVLVSLETEDRPQLRAFRIDEDGNIAEEELAIL